MSPDSNPQRPHTVYRFGNFTLDPATRALHRHGKAVALPPKSFDAIVYLMENHDRAVGRDELISAVWGRVDASDAVVAQTLLRARRAINDTGDRQSRIRTVPRFGYQWVGPFEAVQVRGQVDSPQASTPALGSRHTRWPLAGALVIAVTVLVAVAVSMDRRTATPETTTDGVTSTEAGLTVVMPVSVQPETAETAWIRLGAMDYVASRLREQPGLVVLPSSRTLGLVGDQDVTAVTINRVRDTAGVQNILVPQASFEEAGWRFRLMLDAAGDQQVVEVEAASPLGAAAAATDMMLRRMGIDSTTLPAPDQLTERLQQVDAELLAGQLATARGLIATAPASQAHHPQLRVRQGQLEFRAGQLDIARDIFENLLAGDPALDSEVRARALMGLGAVNLRNRDYVAAEQHYADALERLTADGLDQRDPALAGNAYNGRGVSRVELGRMDDGIADLGRARIAMARAGDEVEAATVGTNIGLLEARRGHPARAISEFENAASTFERFDVRDNLAAVLLSKSRAELQLLRPVVALEDGQRAMDIGATLENPRLQQSISAAYISALLANGQLSRAEQQLRKDEADHPQLALQWLLDSGLTDEAANQAEDMLELELGRNADVTLLAIQSGLLAGRPALVEQWRQRLLPGQPGSGDYYAAAMAEALVLAAGSQVPDPSARLAFETAMTAAASHLTPLDEVRTSSAYVLYLVDSGQLDRASEVLGSFSPYAESDYRAARAALALYQALDDESLAAHAWQRVEALAGERDPGDPVIF
ncbi:hypothetical protein F3N42_02230 [Marinihelvus fidelis]|uniref:OmpR/PhoB-type domain-containing protein n=1 Tax=Marinihelvus fidelis TaxID=2613842 RepID=A0A5N0TH53_9GAMM|nr:winged helix-turn-helix domain-containing protein [Marinihelvus fidelis]KAA9133196.1 hypothetical protein F3N42_02230 [Marinihelvus fidelis]